MSEHKGMQVKIPSFNINLKTMWIIAGVLSHAIVVTITIYISHQINQYQIEHKIEKAAEQVGGLDKTMQERIKINDVRFDNLEKVTNEIRVDVGKTQASQESILSRMNDMSALLAALVSQGKSAENNKQPFISHAVYEVP